jgi:KipI family sensor histidine kinase inhibitor
VVELGAGISVRTSNRVRALGLALEQAGLAGLSEVVPTYRSLAVYYDPLRLDVEALRARIREAIRHLQEVPLPPPRLKELPTVYGGLYGPDLPSVAQHTGLSEAAVIRLHSRPKYHVYMIGFTAGFPYLGGLPPRLITPRLPSPRLRVPAGSVGIGGVQTGAHPIENPSGWQIIGRTCVKLFDPTQEVPTPMLPGDKVRFVPISEAEYLAQGGAPAEPFA